MQSFCAAAKITIDLIDLFGPVFRDGAQKPRVGKNGVTFVCGIYPSYALKLTRGSRNDERDLRGYS